MKLKTTYENLNGAIATLKAVITDKFASDTLRNVIFIVSASGEVRLAAYNTLVACFAPLPAAEVDWGTAQPEETYFQLKSDLLKILDNFKALKKTKVDAIEIDVGEANALLTARETAIDAILADVEVPDYVKNSYSHDLYFRVPAPKLASGIRKEIEGRDMTVSGELMSAVDLKYYLDALISTIPADAKETMGTRIMAVGDDIYTAPQLYFAIMNNRLGTQFRNFILSRSATQFIRSYLDCVDEFYFSKTELENAVVLKFACQNSIAFVNAATTRGALDCTAYKQHSETGLAVDKEYFSDILRRVGTSDACSFTVKIPEQGIAGGVIASKTWKQSFTALVSRLNISEFEGTSLLKTAEDGSRYLEIAFSLRPDLMQKLLFLGLNDKAPAYLYFEPAQSGVKLAVCDETGIWNTKINTLTPKRNDFEWGD